MFWTFLGKLIFKLFGVHSPKVTITFLNGPTAVEMAHRLADLNFNCMWYEEPALPEFPEAIADIRRQIPLPVCVGERLHNGDHGIVVPDADNPRRSVCSEPTVVALSDGRWFCVMRTRRGAIYYAISDDAGHTWSATQPLRYRDGGQPLLQPVSCCPLYRLNDGRFLLTFHDNDGTDPTGRPPGKWPWQIYRTPAYLTVGEERLDSEQPIWFSRPKLFLDNGGQAWRPSDRTEIGVYTSFFEFEGKRYYWYPDRKHFLLGKCISDGFFADIEVPL